MSLFLHDYMRFVGMHVCVFARVLCAGLSHSELRSTASGQSPTHTFLRPRSLTDSSEIGTKPTEPALIKKNSTFARHVFVRLYFVSLSHRLWFISCLNSRWYLNLLISVWIYWTAAISKYLSMIFTGAFGINTGSWVFSMFYFILLLLHPLNLLSQSYSV